MITNKNNYVDTEKYVAPANPGKFADFGNFGEALAKTAKAAKKDMTKPENWTQEMVDFYNYVGGRCLEHAKKGDHSFMCCATDTPKTFNYVVDYLREHNGISFARQTFQGLDDIADGVYFRFIW